MALADKRGRFRCLETTVHRVSDADFPYGDDWQSAANVAMWIDAADERRPWRIQIRERMAEFVGAMQRDVRMLELGSGPGLLAECILQRCPHVSSYTLLDFSPHMMAASRRRLARFPAALFVFANFKSDNWVDSVDGPFDCIMSMQAVHELRHKQHAPRLYAQAYEITAHGGRLLICDHVPLDDTPQSQALYMTEDEQFAALSSAGFGRGTFFCPLLLSGFTRARNSEATALHTAMTLDALREFYARLVVPDKDNLRLIGAFATVPRERFVGPGPWHVITASGYIDTPSDDPAFLYQDVVVALAAERCINNGQPSLHATSMAAANPSAGETVLHIGAGTGYYTAILATLVGQSGNVAALELDPELARRAATNLADHPNVVVERRSGSNGPLPPADVIYVSAGATAPLKGWLDALRPGGRLVFPLTPAEGVGGMLLVTRTDEGPWSARFVSPAAFIPCIGGRDDHTAVGLAQAFRCCGTRNVAALHIGTPPDETCWFAADGWWLSAHT